MPVRGHSRRYGYRHQQLRTQLLAAYRPGQLCALCGKPMWVTNKRDLHLAHDDTRGGYAGLAHRECNTGDAAQVGNRTRHGQGDPRPRSMTRW